MVAIGAEADVPPLAGVTPSTRPEFDEWRGGLGMALPVGRRVIEAHGGTVWSAPGDQPKAGTALRLPMKSTDQSQ